MLLGVLLRVLNEGTRKDLLKASRINTVPSLFRNALPCSCGCWMRTCSKRAQGPAQGKRSVPLSFPAVGALPPRFSCSFSPFGTPAFADVHAIHDLLTPLTVALPCGLSAAQKFYGGLSEALADAKRCLQAAQQRQKQYADLKHRELTCGG